LTPAGADADVGKAIKMGRTCHEGRAYLKPVQTVTAGVPFGRPYNAPFAVR